MPVRARQHPPVGHGEVLCSPPFDQWQALAEANARGRLEWPIGLQELHAAARSETLQQAREYSSAIGAEFGENLGHRLVVTGHQPELYHPGVWVKGFLVQRLSEETGALGLDVVVDTDAADRVEMRMPCMAPEVRICSVPIADGGGAAAYVQLPPPDAAVRTRLRESGLASLGTLRAPALARHFTTFCDALDVVAQATDDLASCMTAARRAYERPAGTNYMEVSVSAQSRTESYARFAAGLMLDASRFREVMNGALADYRRRTGTRSKLQPFPDLGGDAEAVDVPFWLLDGGTRKAVSMRRDGTLYADGVPVAELGERVEDASRQIAGSGLLLAPKAVALTLFERMFVADLFVHGTGGARYDRVTDDVIAGYYGVRPPAFTIASMTLLLPLGARLASAEDVAALEQRLHRFTHNPDQVLGEVEFDTIAECVRAEEIAARKRELVEAIGQVDADRKAIGAQIREANEDLGRMLQPMIDELSSSLERLRAERQASEVLTDRTYPYCLWDPREVMDKVR